MTCVCDEGLQLLSDDRTCKSVAEIKLQCFDVLEGQFDGVTSARLQGRELGFFYKVWFFSRIYTVYKIKIDETINGYPIWKNAEGNFYIYVARMFSLKMWKLGPDYESFSSLMTIPFARFQECPYSNNIRLAKWNF